MIPHELVSFVANKLVAHIKIPLISETVNTEICIYYNNPAQATPMSNSALVYDTEALVTHLEEDPKTTTIKDSSANAHIGTPVNTKLQTATGKIGKGIESLDDGNDDGVSFPDHASLQITGDIFMSCWVKTTTIDSGAFILKNALGENKAYRLQRSGSSGKAKALLMINGVSTPLTGTSVIQDTGIFWKIWAIRKGADFKLFVNKTIEASTTVPELGTIAATIGMPLRLFDGLTNDIVGIQDEVIVSSQIETEAWYDTLYDIEINPTAVTP